MSYMLMSQRSSFEGSNTCKRKPIANRGFRHEVALGVGESHRQLARTQLGMPSQAGDGDMLTQFNPGKFTHYPFAKLARMNRRVAIWPARIEAIFQLHGADAAKELILRKKLQRKELMKFFKGLALFSSQRTWSTFRCLKLQAAI